MILCVCGEGWGFDSSCASGHAGSFDVRPRSWICGACFFSLHLARGERVFWRGSGPEPQLDGARRDIFFFLDAEEPPAEPRGARCPRGVRVTARRGGTCFLISHDYKEITQKYEYL